MIALLIADLQEGFVSEKYLSIVKEIEFLQNRYDICIASRFINEEKPWSVSSLDYTKMHVGSSETNLAFAPINRSIIYNKNGYSCVTPYLQRVLKENNIDEIHIVGCDTDSCILNTAYDLFSSGIAIKVIKDLCFSSGGEEVHDMAIQLLERNIGKINVIGVLQLDN